MNTVSENLGNVLIESLMRDGYEVMSIENKNLLVTYIAQEDGMPLTDINRDFISERQKIIKIKELATACETTILNGFLSPNGNFYRTNRDDQINMIGQKDLLDSRDSIKTVMWKTENVGYVQHSKEEWLEDVYYYGLEFKSKQLFRFNYLKELVTNAKSEFDVIGIDWNSKTPYEVEPIEEVKTNEVEEVAGE